MRNSLAAVERSNGSFDAGHLPLVDFRYSLMASAARKERLRPVLLANRSSRFFTPVSTRTGLVTGAPFSFSVLAFPIMLLPLVISTLALSILMKESVKDFYSAEAQVFPTLLPDTAFSLLGVTISLAQLGVLAVALVVILLLQWFLAGTRTGRQMQATAQNPSVARILGVPVERMILYPFLINAGLAAMASLLISPIYLAKFSNGETLGLIAFAAAIVGGFNQVRGALVGGDPSAHRHRYLP